MTKLISSAVLFLFISLLFLVSSCEKKEPYSEINIPIHSRGENISKELFEFPEGKAIRYRVKADFPAKEITEFYDKAISELGFNINPYNPSADRKWTSYSQKEMDYIEEKSKPAHYGSVWIDKEKQNQIMLSLNYPKSDSDYVYVLCGIQPFFSVEALKEFNENLQTAGEFRAFYELLDKYTEKNKIVDFKKALKENPKNKYLQDYVGIIAGEKK